MSERRKRRRRGCFVALLLAVTALLWAICAVLGAEFWLRLRAKRLQVDYDRYEKQTIMWRAAAEHFDEALWEGGQLWSRYRPGLRVRRNLAGRDFVFETDSFGYRTAEVSIPKPADVFRIVCVGASTTVEGWTNAGTYPSRLQLLLASCLNERVEVVNCGVSGRGSRHLMEYLQDCLRYEPDLIVHYNGVNDLCWHHLRRSRQSLSRRQLLLSESSLVGAVAERFASPPDAVLRDAFRSYTMANYASFIAACRQRGIPVAFCTFAVPSADCLSGHDRALLTANLHNFWHGRGFSFPSYARYMAIYNAELQALTVRLGVPLIPVAEKVHGGLDLFVDICHMTDLGISQKASAIAEAICRDPAAFGLQAGAATGR